eukprot:2433258-Alexandrium_andersonii.AAC.1
MLRAATSIFEGTVSVRTPSDVRALSAADSGDEGAACSRTPSEVHSPSEANPGGEGALRAQPLGGTRAQRHELQTRAL